MAAIDRLGTWQVAVSATAARLAPANKNRRGILFVKHGSDDVFAGCNSGVTTTSGLLFAGTCGRDFTIPTTSEVWAITAGGTLTISAMDLTDIQ